MVTQRETRSIDPGTRPRPASDGDPTDPALLAAALIAAIEGALLVDGRLLSALERHEGYPERGVPPRRTDATTAGLSPREAEVLALLAAGHSNRRIAHALCLNPRTVQRHVANVYLKIGAHNRADATAYTLRNGLARPGDTCGTDNHIRNDTTKLHMPPP